MDYSINHGLIDILKSFDKREKKEFKKFLGSRYLNPYPKTLKLYNAIVKFEPDYDPGKLNRHELFLKLKDKNPYNDSTMRDLISKLSNSANKFLAYSNFIKDEYSQLQHQRNEYFSRNLLSHIDKNIHTSELRINHPEESIADFFINKFRLETSKFNYYVINKKIYNKEFLNESVSILSSTSGYLLALFIMESIKQNDTIIKISRRHEYISNSNIIPELLRSFDLEKTIIDLGKYNRQFSHLFEIYYYLYMMFSKRDSRDFYRLYKQKLLQSDYKINQDEMHFLFGRMIDYCVNKCNEGSAEFYDELFSAYTILLEKKYYTNSINKYLAEDLFRNIIHSAIRANKLKWAELFVNNSKNDMHPKTRDQLINYAYAHIYFEMGHFNKALNYLLNTNQEYITLKLDIKILLLKIFFEMKSFEQIYSLIDSFKHFIANHEFISATRRNKLKDFINYYEILFRAVSRNDAESAGILQKKLLAEKDREFYSWLIKKVKDFSYLKRPIKNPV